MKDRQREEEKGTEMDDRKVKRSNTLAKVTENGLSRFS